MKSKRTGQNVNFRNVPEKQTVQTVKTVLPSIKVKSYATSLFPLSQKRSLSWNF